MDNQELFYDNDHLNADGADEYTKYFVNQIKELI